MTNLDVTAEHSDAGQQASDIAAQGGLPVDTLDRVRTIIAEQLERPIDDVTPETRLEDLGDSLDLIEVVYALEVAFKVDIPLNSKAADEKLDSVQDVARIVDRLVAERAAD